MRPRYITMLIATAAVAAFCAAAPNPVAAEQRHPPHERIQAKSAIHPRTRHARQMDINDLAGHGAWRGCAAPGAVVGTSDSAELAAIYCGRAPVFLASTASDVAVGVRLSS